MPPKISKKSTNDRSKTSTGLICFAVMIVFVAILLAVGSVKSVELPPTCDSLIYCQGDLLHTVQIAQLFEDSKTFVDFSQKNDVETTLSNFAQLMKETDDNPTSSQLIQFIDENFLKEDELYPWIPEDFTPEPAYLSKIIDDEIREFARNLTLIWQDLGRKVKEEVYENPDRHSLIYVPNGFIIPGGRFREYYYWDSYWIIKGLLLSEMTDTVKGMIENLLYIVDKYGHVPNGGRIYYLERSQPPLLSYMTRRWYEQTQDIDWLRDNIDLLEKEVQFWVDNRIITRNINGEDYKIGVYNARSAGPRPESYAEDYIVAQHLETEDEKNEMYIELKSAAESGWDFTTRWIFDENGGTNADLSHTKITRVAPVELNSFLYGAFSNVAFFYTELNDLDKASHWSSQASNMNKTINELLWNENDGIWYDYDLESHTHRPYFAPSNLAPLWTQAYNINSDNKNKLIAGVISYLEKEGIMNYLGGIPSTTVRSGEQWDFPNAWPPLQALVIDGLYDSGTVEGRYWARVFAERWVKANLIGFTETGLMYEKYDAEVPGHYGYGGEYVVQAGFGWSNGVVQQFINTYYTQD